VWFVAANTVYRAVPYQVVADWTQQGRLAEADMLRPAGSQDAWKRVGEWEHFADYLPRPIAAAPDAAAQANAIPAEVLEGNDVVIHTRRRRESDDDDVDMIPLIDISMVLLVFFIIISATGALSPVDVPDMRYGGELAQSAEAITISIERASDVAVDYSVRVGTTGPKPEHARLPNDVEALKVLDSLLAERTRPPEVRIACAKDLPSARVHEMAFELKKRMDQRKINSFTATVNEAPKK